MDCDDISHSQSGLEGKRSADGWMRLYNLTGHLQADIVDSVSIVILDLQFS